MGREPNEEKVREAVEKIQNVIRHHYEHHDSCTNPEWCIFLQGKVEARYLINKKLDKEEMKKVMKKMSERTNCRFDYDFQLNDEGITLCEREVDLRFNTSTIANLLCCDTTNALEFI